MRTQYAIGIDMGGTNTAFGIVDMQGQVVGRGIIKTQKHADVNLFMDELHDALTALINQAGGIGNIKGIGMGAPNGNFYTGNVEDAPNLPWKGTVPFVALLEEKFGVPATLTNDANAAAIGEMTYGVARGMNDFIMITLGTGVGSGIVVNGQLVYGHDGFAGELGHTIIVRTNGRQCGCERTGCLETYTSATGVARTARELLETRKEESMLRNIPPEEITSREVFDAATKGDAIALEVFDYTGQLLGEAFADFVAFSAPEAIIIFGGLAKAGELIMRPIRENMEKNLMSIWKGKIKLLFSGLNEADAAILGASALVWQKR